MALPTVIVTPGLGTTINTLQNAGQNTMANSHPVVLASDGPLPLPASIAVVASAALESNHVLKASAGSLKSVFATIGAASGWLMLFDATSAPADGAVSPKYAIPVTSSNSTGFASAEWHAPLLFATGITAVFSSTGPFTKTASATAAFFAQVI